MSTANDTNGGKSDEFRRSIVTDQVPRVGRSFNIGVKSVKNPLLCDKSQAEKQIYSDKFK